MTKTKRAWAMPMSGTERAMRLMLLIPFVGLLWVPFYNQAVPELFGFPFFYWYQFVWVPVSMLIMWAVWRSERS
jgi:hypothetical protein